MIFVHRTLVWGIVGKENWGGGIEFNHHSVPLYSLSGPPPLHICQSHLLQLLLIVSRLKLSCIIGAAALFRSRKGPLCSKAEILCGSNMQVSFPASDCVERKSPILFFKWGCMLPLFIFWHLRSFSFIARLYDLYNLWLYAFLTLGFIPVQWLYYFFFTEEHSLFTRSVMQDSKPQTQSPSIYKKKSCDSH